MFPLKRPSRPKKLGLSFSSSSQKRLRSPISPPSKRIHTSPTPSIPPSLSTSLTKTKIQTRVLIISDTHGHSTLPKPISEDQKIDVVLHCGDLSECGTIQEYRNTIELLASIPAPLKLVIAGNHDVTLDQEFWETNCSEEGERLVDDAKDIWSSDEAKEAGIEFLDEGMHEFVLGNGASLRVYASPFTRNSQGVREWGLGYESAADRYNPEGEGISYGRFAGTKNSVLDAEVDVLMTHGPAKYRLDLSSYSESLGCPHLFRAIRRSRPMLHVFGHVHNAYWAEIV